MKRLCVVAAIAAVLGGVLIGSAVAAQPPGGGRGGMGGMFGGGMFGGGMIGMLSNEQVQKELQETPDQVAKVKEITDKLAADRREAFSGVRDLPQDERRAKFEELNKKMQEESAAAMKKIDGILLAQQVERLRGVYLWVAGTAALADPEIAKALKITDEQKTKLQEIQQGTMEGMRGMRDLSAEERQQKMQEARKAAEEKVAGVLTADQKAELTKMKGKEFKLDMTGMRRGGRRGGGGGGGGPST